jgi:hypothetical protein
VLWLACKIVVFVLQIRFSENELLLFILLFLLCLSIFSFSSSRFSISSFFFPIHFFLFYTLSFAASIISMFHLLFLIYSSSLFYLYFFLSFSFLFFILAMKITDNFRIISCLSVNKRYFAVSLNQIIY